MKLRLYLVLRWKEPVWFRKKQLHLDENGNSLPILLLLIVRISPKQCLALEDKPQNPPAFLGPLPELGSCSQHHLHQQGLLGKPQMGNDAEQEQTHKHSCSRDVSPSFIREQKFWYWVNSAIHCWQSSYWTFLGVIREHRSTCSQVWWSKPGAPKASLALLNADKRWQLSQRGHRQQLPRTGARPILQWITELLISSPEQESPKLPLGKLDAASSHTSSQPKCNQKEE